MAQSNGRKKVVVLGAGVGGLSAAHMLVRRGFDVEMYEKLDIIGGKARSMRTDDILPGEHGFRFFPGFYKHLPATLAEIPLPHQPGKTVYDNLEPALVVGIAQSQNTGGKVEARPTLWVPARFPRTLAGIKRALTILAYWHDLGLAPGELRKFVLKLIDVSQMSQERRLAELETVGWWEYIDAENSSKQYQSLLGKGLTRALVALKAEIGCTRTVGDILLQLFIYLVLPGKQGDRLFNQPTQDAWLIPWEAYLTGGGHPGGATVTIHKSMTVQKLVVEGGRVTGVVVQPTPKPEQAGVPDTFATEPATTVTADHYVLSVPTNRACNLLQASLPEALWEAGNPPLSNIANIKLAWMNGIQYYLTVPWADAPGQTIHVESSWSLTSVSQRQFWSAYDFGKLTHLGIQGVLSVDISDWKAPGQFTTTLPAGECNANQIAAEVWAQLCAGQPSLKDVTYRGFHLDPDMQTEGMEPIYPVDQGGAGKGSGHTAPAEANAGVGGSGAAPALGSEAAGGSGAVPAGTGGAGPATPAAAPRPTAPLRGVMSTKEFLDTQHKIGPIIRDVNAEPLMVNTIGSWADRPETSTVIPNLFLASDYVRTYTDLATMEGANEAARRAVNAILDAEGSSAPREKLWRFYEDPLLAPLRWLDRRRFKAGKPQLQLRLMWTIGMNIMWVPLALLGLIGRLFIAKPEAGQPLR